MTLDVCIHKQSSKIISRTLPRQRVGSVETSRRSRNKFRAGRLNAMVSRATSAAKAASRVAYIARLKVVPFPPEIVGEFFVSGKILQKMQHIPGNACSARAHILPHTQSGILRTARPGRARLQSCHKVFAIDTEFGEGTTGKGTALAVPQSLRNRYGILGTAPPGTARLCACPHTAAYSIRNSGKARPGRARL